MQNGFWEGGGEWHTHTGAHTGVDAHTLKE